MNTEQCYINDKLRCDLIELKEYFLNLTIARWSRGKLTAKRINLLLSDPSLWVDKNAMMREHRANNRMLSAPSNFGFMEGRI